MRNRFASKLAGFVSVLLAVSTAWCAPLERRPNNTLRMPQRPAVFGYQFVNAFPGVTFQSPMAIVAPPGETNRLFIVERAGRVAVITNLASPSREVFLDVTNRIHTSRDGGLQAMAFHPGFATNGYFYLFYTGNDTPPPAGDTNRISFDILARYNVPAPGANSALPATGQTLLRQKDREGDHNGADIHFGSDGYLYLSLGDEGSPRAVGYDYYTNSQSIDKDFFSGMIRIDVDRKPGNLMPNPHPAVVPGTYLVPADNPFVGATHFNGLAVNPAEVRTEFWAVGLRNPFRFSFDDTTGLLYLGDVGQKAYEEINIIRKGGNYGWIFREGAQPTPTVTRPAPPGFTNYIDPIYEYPWGTGATEGKCVIGGIVYRGKRISQLYGYYVFGDYINNRIWALKHQHTNVTDFQSIATLSSVVGFGADPSNGDLLAASIVDGTIYRLIYDTNTSTGTRLPETLADSGAFANLTTLQPNPGVVPYDLNVPFWSDHASKSRWVSVPDINLTIGFDATNNWRFPTGTVWIKHFELQLTNGVPASAQRLETRLLVKNTEGIYGATYRWGSSMTNATLVPEEGMDEHFVIRDSAGGIVRTQQWHYPARVECLSCHTPGGGFALGFNTPQMNRDYDYGVAITNQIQALSEAGYFDVHVPNTIPMLALAAATNTTASVEFRVRSYLAANCAQCHHPGGLPEQQAAWDARIITPLALAGIVNGPLADSLGDTNNRVVRFGSLDNSVLYRRVANLGPHHMPPLSTTVVNPQAVELLATWIRVPPPSSIAGISLRGDGTLQLTLSGSWGWSSIVEAATNLPAPAWQAVGTNIFDTDGAATFIDTEIMDYPRRYYRLVVP